jgi:hypothetical protein
LSVAVKLTLTAWLYQPFESGARAGAAPVIDGPVSSYLNAEPAALLLLPALSVHVIVPVAELLSGPEYVPPEQPARPDPGLGSLPPPLKATGALYQPAWSGARVGLPPVTVGATESMRTLTVF